MKFLCDEMLKGLARWLRAAGYDTLIEADGRSDRSLLERAAGEGRLLVTRDRKLLEHRNAAGVVLLLRANGLEACAHELAARLDLDWLHRPFSRCLVCNTELTNAAPALWEQVPPGARAAVRELRYCPCCDKVFWAGGHVRRMDRRLRAWQAAVAPDAGGGLAVR